jgi:hypothetical protein
LSATCFQWVASWVGDNAALLDELSNKLEQKAQYFRGLADNARMKAYMGSGFTPQNIVLFVLIYC